MATKNTNRTILAIGIVAVIGFLAVKLWPSIAKMMKGSSGGSGGSGGAAGVSSYVPYYPYTPNSQQSGGLNLGAQMSGGAGFGNFGAGSNPNAGLIKIGSNEYMNPSQSAQMVKEDIASGAYNAQPLALNSSAITAADLADTNARISDYGDGPTALGSTVYNPTDSNLPGADLPSWIQAIAFPDTYAALNQGSEPLPGTNEYPGYMDSGYTSNLLGNSLISSESLQSFDLAQDQQSVNAADTSSVNAQQAYDANAIEAASVDFTGPGNDIGGGSDDDQATGGYENS